MLSLVIGLCVATAAAPLQWSDIEMEELKLLRQHDALQVFDGNDLAQARILLRKYPATSAHAEEKIANMSNEDKATLRINDHTKSDQVISSSLTECADCLSELMDASEEDKFYAGELYALVVYYGVTMTDSSVLNDDEKAKVEELVTLMRQGTFDDGDFGEARTLLRRLSPETYARAEETVNTMSDKDRAAFRNKDPRLQEVLIASLTECKACTSEGSHLNAEDLINLGRLYAMVVSYGVMSSSLMLRMSPLLVMIAVVTHFVIS